MRLIDADSLINDAFELISREELREDVPQIIKDYCDAQPTVDAVPVIRCKDCVFWEHAFDDWGKCYGIMAGLGTYESGFCAWAERKEECIKAQ